MAEIVGTGNLSELWPYSTRSDGRERAVKEIPLHEAENGLSALVAEVRIPAKLISRSGAS